MRREEEEGQRSRRTEEEGERQRMAHRKQTGLITSEVLPGDSTAGEPAKVVQRACKAVIN